MSKIVIGIIIGIIFMISVRAAFAAAQEWKVGNITVYLIRDGGINCYVAENSNSWNAAAISCLKTK